MSQEYPNQPPYGNNPQFPQPPQGYPSQPMYQQLPMQPPVAKKRVRWPFFVGGGCLILAVVICGGLFLTGTFAAKNASQVVATVEAATRAPSSSSSAHHKLNEVISVDGVWQVTVTNVKISHGDDIFKPKTGNVYLLITVAMKNISAAQQAASSLIQSYVRQCVSPQTFFRSDPSSTMIPSL